MYKRRPTRQRSACPRGEEIHGRRNENDRVSETKDTRAKINPRQHEGGHDQILGCRIARYQHRCLGRRKVHYLKENILPKESPPLESMFDLLPLLMSINFA